jgi:hypothetical protein
MIDFDFDGALTLNELNLNCFEENPELNQELISACE